MEMKTQRPLCGLPKIPVRILSQHILMANSSLRTFHWRNQGYASELELDGKQVCEFPNLLTSFQGSNGCFPKEQMDFLCKRPWALGGTWKGSGRVGECLYSLPDRFSFEMERTVPTITGAEFKETTKKRWWDGELGRLILILASSEFQERIGDLS